MLDQIKAELSRLAASETSVLMTRAFDPSAGELVKIEIQSAYWHMLPGHFLALLRDLPDGAGSSAIGQAIEQNAPLVWHGPAPQGPRDPA